MSKGLRLFGIGCALLAVLALAIAAPPTSRFEARSANLLAVGIVTGDRMTLHLSRSSDNTPVHDAQLAVRLRGTLHPTIVEPDGGYILETQDLALPGVAAMTLVVTEGGAREELSGTLQVTEDGGKQEDKNGARQLGWWILNFAVCIGFLMLISRRRKAAVTSKR